MAENTECPAAIYSVEPSHFGSVGMRVGLAVANFVAAFLLAGSVYYFKYEILASALRLRRHTSREFVVWVGVAALLILISRYWSNLRGQKYELQLHAGRITKSTGGKAINIFPWEIAKVSEIKDGLSVPGLLVRSFNASLFIPKGLPAYEEVKTKIETMKMR